MANQYNEDSIQILESQEAVRTRPAMYIGDTGKKGLHHLVWEILDNSVDEHMAGHCTKIDIIVSKDNRSVTVIDNGRGIPVAVKQEDPKKRSTLEIVLTELHAGGKFGDDGSGYEASGGLHGVGASCVNFLSLRLDAEVYRDKKKYLLSFDRGIPAGEVAEVGNSNSTGTKITFTPDYNIFGQFAVEDAFREVLVDEFEIDEVFAECSGKWRKALINGPVNGITFFDTFKSTNLSEQLLDVIYKIWNKRSNNNIQFDETVLLRRIRETAYLNGGLKINYKNEYTGTKEEFHFEGGIADYVSYLASTKSNLYPSKPFFFDNKSGKINVQVAFQYGDDDDETIYTYANNIYTLDGGTHLSGFKTSITRIVNQFARSSSVLKEKDPNLTGEDIRDGIVAIISVRLPQPQFEGQTKGKLGSQEVEGVVNRLFSEAVTEYFEKNPNIVKFISERALRSARARAAAKKASENIKRQSFLGRSGSLPGKLSDCNSEDNVNTELFIVEGDSAAGCFVGSTRISLADGREISFIELIEEQEKGIQNFCYTVRNDGQIGLAEIKYARLTKKNAELVKVTLDNGESVICTPDHKWMKSDGSYIRADEMSEGLSLKSKNDSLIKCLKFETLNYTEDVYDIEVPESHNFALSCGVFVHNSSKFGRDPEFQAVMPIRGKIINPEKNDYARLMQNEEVSSIISALGTGIRDDFKLEDLRYGKIVIMTDADDDGAHIAALLMTFFYRFMRPLVLAGKLYIAKPPLYRVNVKSQKFYIHSNEELETYRNKYGDKIDVIRFKGLGEMDGDELGVTTMEIGTRHIIKVAVENAEEASDLISTLMGSEVAPRKEHIIKKSAIRAGEEIV